MIKQTFFTLYINYENINQLMTENQQILYLNKEYEDSGMYKCTEYETGSFSNYLSKGCRLCQEGATMVLFVTGLCTKSCFYCPISNEKRGKDLVFANERHIKSDEDILQEVELMDALGTGITGGEPLLKIEKVLHYIQILKFFLGKDHHIHLYTSLSPDRKILKKLADAGLDEIRLHPPQAIWGNLKNSPYADSLQNAKKLGIDVGIEVPSIKGTENVAAFAEYIGVFLNLNELEFSDSNSKALLKNGFSLESDASNAVADSSKYAKTALPLCKRAHFCSSTHKDAVQLRKRFQRIAKNMAREFDEITDDGTLVYGIIEYADKKLTKKILDYLEIPLELFEVKKGRIELAWWVLEDLKEEIKEELKLLGAKLLIIERYPFTAGLLVELIPL